MTSVLIISIILFLLFGNEKVRIVGRIALTIFVAAGILGLFCKIHALEGMFDTNNFLLLSVLYILFFGVERFKEKSKVSIFILLGAAVVFVIIHALQDGLTGGEWKNLLILHALLLGAFIIGYIINSIIHNKRE